MKSKYFLMSLDEEENDKLATLLSNKTARKILQYLSDHEEATQTQLANALDYAPSTIHYNLEQLMEAELIEWEHYHYSKKGKEVRHYRLAKQYIIIAPKKKENALETLKKLLPSVIVGVTGTTLLAYFGDSDTQPQAGVRESQVMVADTSQAVASPDIISMILQSSAFWFLIGSSITLFSLFVTIMFLSYKKNREKSI